MAAGSIRSARPPAPQVLRQLREKLRLNAAAVQVPMGLEDALRGLIDVVERRAFTFEGKMGETIVEIPLPDEYQAEVEAKRAELVERVGEVDEEVGELFLMEQPVDAATLRAGIRR